MDLCVFAGPNGSGKSTLVNPFLEKDENSNYLFVCPDNVARALTISDEYERYKKAMRLSEAMRENALNKRIPLCFETVLSTKEKVYFIEKAKNLGYKIKIVYVMTQSPEINLSRVKKRASDGGHDVPPDKLIARYYKSLGFIPDLVKLADEIFIYDNSFENKKPRLIYCYNSEYTKNAIFQKYVFPYLYNTG